MPMKLRIGATWLAVVASLVLGAVGATAPASAQQTESRL
jgi:hypothetical protein